MANVLGELFQDIADAIRGKTGETGTMKPIDFPSAIASIVTGSGGGGGGSSADVRYVTFMNGTEVLYKKPVAVGDDCVDVLQKGFIETPTKESDVQYNYTYYGWGASDGGAADTNILKNITEDKTVYAIYTSTVRTYTITYLDDDGVTVLKTEQVAYGTVPSYMPGKADHSFDKWTPTPVAVKGDATYTASWTEQITFAKGSWADIARISEAGEASKYFAVGDTRTENFGTYGNQTIMILGFSHDNLADGSGKAGISIGMTGRVSCTDSEIAKTNLSAELQAVLKSVSYSTRMGSSVGKRNTANVVPYSFGELGKSFSGGSDGCTKYAKVPTLARDYAIRCRGYHNNGFGNQDLYFQYDQVSRASDASTIKYFMGHFCV